MPPIQAVLLFTAPPLFDPETAAANLIEFLNAAGRPADPDSPEPDEVMRFRQGEFIIGIRQSEGQLERDEFVGATQSPLCRKSADALNHAIEDHRHTMLISVTPISGGQQSNLLAHLRLTHYVTTFFTKLTAPFAVHWRDSNMLMTSGQYREFAGQSTPWALFARLESPELSGAPVIAIQNADKFIGAPVQLHSDRVSLDTACAAALAFLRHAATSDVPLGDGQTFGPEPGMLFRLNIVQPDSEHPTGQFHLWEADGQPETVLGDPARSPGATFKSSRETLAVQIRPAEQLPPLVPAELDHGIERNHGIALGFLMLVIMPPIGAALLVANSIFGSNGLRTGFVAMVTVAIAMVIGAYTFLNPGEINADALGTTQIQVETIQN